MSITSHSLKAAQHGSQFFLEHPDAAKRMEEMIKTEGIAGIFHKAAEVFQKELSDHDAARTDLKDTRSDIHTLNRKLRDLGSNLENWLNNLLEVQGISEDHWVDLKRSKEESADYSSFLNDLKQHEEIYKDEGKLKAAVAEFEKDLVKFKEALTHIGDSMSQISKEGKEVAEATDKYRPIVMGLSQGLYRFFAIENPMLFNEWKSGKKRKTVKKDGENAVE
jgi:hypothetical protein